MAFKENLLKKISLDQLKKQVLSSLGPSGSGKKIDRKAMKKLIETARYRYLNLRGLELYTVAENDSDGKQHVLVLDNELPFYNTTVNDVLLRREPTLKEMISIRNAIKILNDKDVILTRGEQSVERVYQACINDLDLAYTTDDIKKLEYDGRAAVEWNDSDAVIEALSLFFELLCYSHPPKVLMIEDHYINGSLSRNDSGKELFGPSVVYNINDGKILLIKDKINFTDNEDKDLFRKKISGNIDPDITGPAVFVFLSEEVIRKKPVVLRK